jgi:hypothetical protein
MDIHHSDASSADPRLSTTSRCLCRRNHTIDRAGSREVQARCSACDGPEKRPAIRHRLSPSNRVPDRSVDDLVGDQTGNMLYQRPLAALLFSP